MHSCGNPFHDVPMWLAWFAPFLLPVIVWIRALLTRAEKSR
jgi:hypothetical protein